MPYSRLALCTLLLVLWVSAISAQSTRPRRVSDAIKPANTQPAGAIPTEPEPGGEAPRQRRPEPPRQPPVLKPRERDKPLWAGNAITPLVPRPAKPSAAFADLLQQAIDLRLGTPYRYGAIGDGAFDCSGFVWSVFQEVGMGFQRDSARKYWEQFTEPRPGEEYQFGTLVFFSGQSHIGIVAADGEGFYHASSSKGVMYSRFDNYWLPRVDGFRRVAVAPAATTANVPPVTGSRLR